MGLDATIKMFQKGTTSEEIEKNWSKTPTLVYWRNFHDLDTVWLHNERLVENEDYIVYVSVEELLKW